MFYLKLFLILIIGTTICTNQTVAQSLENFSVTDIGELNERQDVREACMNARSTREMSVVKMGMKQYDPPREARSTVFLNLFNTIDTSIVTNNKNVDIRNLKEEITFKVFPTILDNCFNGKIINQVNDLRDAHTQDLNNLVSVIKVVEGNMRKELNATIAQLKKDYDEKLQNELKKFKDSLWKEMEERYKLKKRNN